MQIPINVLILAAGNTFYKDSDGGYPIYLAEFNGTPIIERVIRCCETISPTKIIVACREQDVDHYHLQKVPSLLNDRAVMLPIQGSTRGAACTALLASPHIENDNELLIISINEILDVDFFDIVDEFRSHKYDAGVITFESIHPRYSYVKTDTTSGLIIEASEKNPISQRAAASFYWFSSGTEFISAAKDMIRKDGHTGGVFYICPTINQLILKQKRVGALNIDKSRYHPLKTDRQLQSFEAIIDHQ